MFTNWRKRWMSSVRTSTKRQIIFEQTSTEEYSKWNEKHTRDNNRRLKNAEQISNLEDRLTVSTQAMDWKGKRIFLKNENRKDLLENMQSKQKFAFYRGLRRSWERDKRTEKLWRKYLLKISLTWRRKWISRFRKHREFQTKWTEGAPYHNSNK